jgi:GDP-4-dehydro-6-deoxy-D-mannose reductase
MKVLITGGTGFAGSHLVEALLAQGVTPHVTTAFDKPSYVHGLLPSDHIHLVDLTNKEATFALFEHLQPTQIYHLAAYASVGDSFAKAQEVLENNLWLQLNVLEAIKQHTPHARLLVVGSAMEYDTVHYHVDKISEAHPLGPVSPYAVSKVIQDMLGFSYQSSYHLDIIRVRPFNHTGERQTGDFAIPAFAKQIVAIERGEQAELSVGNLSSIRDFTDVKDISQGYITLMEKGESGEVYNLGSGHGYQMEEVLSQMIELSTQSIPVQADPAKLRPHDVHQVVADTTKVQQLGWSAQIPLKETLQRVIEYWRNKS